MTLTGVTVSAFTYDSSANPQTGTKPTGTEKDGQRWANISTTIDTTTAESTNLTLNSATSGILGTTAGDVVLNGFYGVNELVFGGGEVSLAAGESVDISITMSSSQYTNDGTYVGLSGLGLTYQVTPEPTTATLSLLALAGLCARRRRK